MSLMTNGVKHLFVPWCQCPNPLHFAQICLPLPKIPDPLPSSLLDCEDRQIKATVKSHFLPPLGHRRPALCRRARGPCATLPWCSCHPGIIYLYCMTSVYVPDNWHHLSLIMGNMCPMGAGGPSSTFPSISPTAALKGSRALALAPNNLGRILALRCTGRISLTKWPQISVPPSYPP